MFFEEVARKAGYPKNWPGFTGSTTARVLFVDAQRAAYEALNAHVPKPPWLTSDLLTLNPSPTEAAKIDEMVASIKSQLERGLDAIVIKDEEYRGSLWLAFIQANLGLVPMLEVLGDSRDPLFDMAKDYDAPARLGVFQAVRDMSIKYSQRQPESTWKRWYCVLNPGSCLAVELAKRVFGLGSDEPIVAFSAEPPSQHDRRQALGVEPLTILILAGAAVLALVGIAAVAGIAYMITKTGETKSFNDLYKSRCLRADRTQADIEWCNKLKAPESPDSPAAVLGKVAAIVGVAFVVGLFGYRYATRGATGA